MTEVERRALVNSVRRSGGRGDGGCREMVRVDTIGMDPMFG